MPDFAGGSKKGGVPGARHLEKQVLKLFIFHNLSPKVLVRPGILIGDNENNR
jgi:hypothetical protein